MQAPGRARSGAPATSAAEPGSERSSAPPSPGSSSSISTRSFVCRCPRAPRQSDINSYELTGSAGTGAGAEAGLAGPAAPPSGAGQRPHETTGSGLPPQLPGAAVGPGRRDHPREPSARRGRRTEGGPGTGSTTVTRPPRPRSPWPRRPAPPVRPAAAASRGAPRGPPCRAPALCGRFTAACGRRVAAGPPPPSLPPAAASRGAPSARGAVPAGTAAPHHGSGPAGTEMVLEWWNRQGWKRLPGSSSASTKTAL